MSRWIIGSVAWALGLFLALGCGDGQSSVPPGPPASGGATDRQGAKVAKIVFVGQQTACECTRKRIDTSWEALSAVLADHREIEVERIALDVDEQRYNELDDLRSLLIAPGIYCFGADGKLIEMLQGEVEEYKIAELIR